jgi:hypothetical protein
VESLHSVEGDFANGNMKPLTAQMLVEEGIVRFTHRHDQRLKYQRGEITSDVPKHFRPWMRRHANMLAEYAGMEAPYPDEPILEPDNGERQLYDYYLEQQERERLYTYSEGMTHCPCESCSARRLDCPCDSCSTFRRSPGCFAREPIAAWLEENRVEAYENLMAAAAAQARLSNSHDDARRSRQLEVLATMTRGGLFGSVLEHGPKITGVDFAQLAGYAPPESEANAETAIVESTTLTILTAARGLMTGLLTGPERPALPARQPPQTPPPPPQIPRQRPIILN